MHRTTITQILAELVSSIKTFDFNGNITVWQRVLAHIQERHSTKLLDQNLQ